MKIFELIALLGKLPALADVSFHTLTDKESGGVDTYMDDANYYEVHFDKLTVEKLDDNSVQITTD